jgi:hypothetical protein
MSHLTIPLIATLRSYIAKQWRRLRATGDAGEIEEKTLIIALMAGATIAIIAGIIIVAITSKAEEGAGFLSE